MELAIYAKKRTTKDGKMFYSYLTKLTTRTGEQETVQVKFRDECGKPKGEDCPMYINVERKLANLATKDYVREDTGEVCTGKELWVSGWSKGREFVDTSLDGYDFS